MSPNSRTSVAERESARRMEMIIAQSCKGKNTKLEVRLDRTYLPIVNSGLSISDPRDRQGCTRLPIMIAGTVMAGSVKSLDVSSSTHRGPRESLETAGSVKSIYYDWSDFATIPCCPAG